MQSLLLEFTQKNLIIYRHRVKFKIQILYFYLLFFFLGCSGNESVVTEATTGLLYQPLMMMDGKECGEIGGMIDKGNRSTRRKYALVLLCRPQIPNDLARARIRSPAVGGRRLTA
jgi:hypothetical protein